MRRVRLVIADRRPIVLQGFASLFAAQTDFEVVASCLDGASCLEAIRELTPDVVLVEDGFSDVTAPEMLAVVNAENLPTRLVLYTASVARGDLAAAIAAGTCSAIAMSERPETVLRSLRRVAARRDQARIGNEKNGAFGENALAVLTDQEREIMRLVVRGLSNKAIARQLNVSPSTIKVRLKHMFEKLEINNRSELTALALSQRYVGIGVLAAVILAAMDDGQAASLNSVDASHMVADSFTVIAADGTPEVVTIKIKGSKGSAGASGAVARAVIKARSAANAVPETPISTRKFIDSGADMTGSTNAPRPSSGAYGTFMTAAAAVWIYVIDIIQSVAKAHDLGDGLADVSTSATAYGAKEPATHTLAGSVAASPDSHDNPTSLNSIYDWSFAFGAPRDDTAALRDKLPIFDADAGEDIAEGNDNSPHAASAHADTVHRGSGTVNVFAGHTIDHGGFGDSTTPGASQHPGDDTTSSAGDDPDHGKSQRDLHASENGPAAAKQHAKHDASGDDSNHGQSQRDLHASEHGSAAAGQHAEHRATPGSDANPGRDLHASEDGSAAAKQHAKHHAPGNDSNPGQTQRDVHASEHGSAAVDQHAKHATTPESDVNPGQSQRNLHAAPENASNNPQSESGLNGGKDKGTAETGQAQTAAAPELGDSFHFKNEMAGSKAPDSFEVHGEHEPASTEHGEHAARHDGLTQDAGLMSISLADHSNCDHVKGTEHHLMHDLIM